MDMIFMYLIFSSLRRVKRHDWKSDKIEVFDCFFLDFFVNYAIFRNQLNTLDEYKLVEKLFKCPLSGTRKLYDIRQ